MNTKPGGQICALNNPPRYELWDPEGSKGTHKGNMLRFYIGNRTYGLEYIPSTWALGP